MAKQMHPVLLGLRPSMDGELRELVLHGRGHDWARLVLLMNDMLIDKERRLENLGDTILRKNGHIEKLTSALILAREYMLDYLTEHRAALAGYKPKQHKKWAEHEALVNEALEIK